MANRPGSTGRFEELYDSNSGFFSLRAQSRAFSLDEFFAMVGKSEWGIKLLRNKDGT